MFIYHYCMHYEHLLSGKVHHIDGIAKLDNEIKCMDGYRKLKKLIEPVHHETATISNLTLLSNSI